MSRYQIGLIVFLVLSGLKTLWGGGTDPLPQVVSISTEHYGTVTAAYLEGLPDRPPFILAPGLTNNSYALKKLLYFLHQEGYPVYAINYPGMGRGEFRTPLNYPSSPSGPNFAELVEVVGDVLAYIYIRHETPPFYVGHSMGGMLILQFLDDRSKSYLLSGLVLIGTPVHLDILPEPLEWLADSEVAQHFLLSRPVLRLTLLNDYLDLIKQESRGSYTVVRALEFIWGEILRWMPTSVWTAGNIDGRSLIKYVRKAISQLSPSLLEDFVRFHHEGTPYVGNLSHIRTPTLIIAGENDGLVDPQDGQELFDRLGSERKWLLRLPGYSHIDLLIGESVKREVFPPMCDFAAVARPNLRSPRVAVSPSPLFTNREGFSPELLAAQLERLATVDDLAPTRWLDEMRDILYRNGYGERNVELLFSGLLESHLISQMLLDVETSASLSTNLRRALPTLRGLLQR